MSTLAQPKMYSQRIVGSELPKEGNPILISNYKVTDIGNKDYRIGLDGMQNPFIQINWPRENGKMSVELAKVLGAGADTYVYTDSDSEYCEGLRRLDWGFWVRLRLVLYSFRLPWDRGSALGSLLGSVVEGEGRIKIPGVDFYVQPEVALRGKDLWETQLYAQDNSLINSSAPDANAIVRFVKPKEPDEQWLESEVERFRNNGENLGRSKVADLYEQLREDIWEKHWVRSREILAWSTMLAEEDPVKVPRSGFV